jgi:MOSC domain-containing protein YiiM
VTATKDPVGRLEAINSSRGGVPKAPLFEALITETGLDGDRQRFRYHGGPDRAVVVYSLDVIRALQREGHPIEIGSVGENLTVSGVEWSAVVPGTELHVGAVRLLITAFTSPCESVRPFFADGAFERISQKRHPNWSRVCARVLEGGLVRIGDAVAIAGSNGHDAGC